jgi:hypothetical protein
MQALTFSVSNDFDALILAKQNSYLQTKIIGLLFHPRMEIITLQLHQFSIFPLSLLCALVFSLAQLRHHFDSFHLSCPGREAQRVFFGHPVGLLWFAVCQSLYSTTI